MKRLLGLLAAVGITASTAATVVACGKEKPPVPEDDKITSGDLNEVLKVKNVLVDRLKSGKDLIGEGADNSKITSQGIVDGLNYANNTALTVEDIKIEFAGADKTRATIQATENSKFTGLAQVYLNHDVNVENIVLNTKLGDIYISNKTWADKESTIVLATLITEFIGDRNRVLDTVADQVFKLSIGNILNPGLIIIENNSITLNFNKLDDTSCFIKGQITVSFKQNDDQRLKIQDAIKTKDLGKLTNNDKETVLKKAYELNKANMPGITETQFVENTYLLNKEGSTTEFYLQFAAGTSLFKGHDDTAASLIQIDPTDLHLPITFTV